MLMDVNIRTINQYSNNVILSCLHGTFWDIMIAITTFNVHVNIMLIYHMNMGFDPDSKTGCKNTKRAQVWSRLQQVSKQEDWTARSL